MNKATWISLGAEIIFMIGVILGAMWWEKLSAIARLTDLEERVWQLENRRK